MNKLAIAASVASLLILTGCASSNVEEQPAETETVASGDVQSCEALSNALIPYMDALRGNGDVDQTWADMNAELDPYLGVAESEKISGMVTFFASMSILGPSSVEPDLFATSVADVVLACTSAGFDAQPLQDAMSGE